MGGETLTPIRRTAKALIDESVPEGTEFFSDRDEKKFTDLTGGPPPGYSSKHEQMKANWAGGGKMTACNEFAGWYARMLANKLGISMKENLGRFDIDKTITKSEAWVTAAAGVKPRYGDILLHQGVHMDVALGFASDGSLMRVAAGQGRPGTRDILKRVKGQSAFNWRNLKGWVDIELYFGAGVPNWLLGWWEIRWRGDTYYYYFERTRVRWTEYRPRSTMMSMITTDGGAGGFTVTNRGNVTIEWESGTVEKFNRSILSSGETMDGTWNEAESLTAVKMD